MESAKTWLGIVARIVAVLFLTIGPIPAVLAWTGPTVAPPGGNTAPPLNTSATGQSKAGTLNLNNPATPGYPISVGGTASSWTGVFNWPYNSTPSGSFGLLVGGQYSEFENPSGYYSLVAYSNYGLYTNGAIYAAAGYYGPGAFGGGFQYTSGGACQVANALTGACSCPGYAPSARYSYYMDTNSTYGGGRGYVCTS